MINVLCFPIQQQQQSHIDSERDEYKCREKENNKHTYALKIDGEWASGGGCCDFSHNILSIFRQPIWYCGWLLFDTHSFSRRTYKSSGTGVCA